MTECISPDIWNSAKYNKIKLTAFLDKVRNDKNEQGNIHNKFQILKLLKYLFKAFTMKYWNHFTVTKTSENHN